MKAVNLEQINRFFGPNGFEQEWMINDKATLHYSTRSLSKRTKDPFPLSIRCSLRKISEDPLDPQNPRSISDSEMTNP